ncbi:hypothetical protein CK203_034910 [Vitis vinifera]|uniref:Uncharacterized protein n=1 Tax=Vitis vinifera TaxID=29760 RepID=A0A438FYT8_VITVI|nr:hypothetical protein CK203_034910 [Vitis vinifera]
MSQVCIRYNTFSPDTVKKLPKSDLAEEIWRLQAALGEQTEITKFSQQEFERLQNVMFTTLTDWLLSVNKRFH